MKKHKQLNITQLHLKELLDYNEITGVFRWRLNNGKRALEGERAGCYNGHGYRIVGINNQTYFEHRLAWLYVHGDDPLLSDIHHKNHVKDDNSIYNLEKVSARSNKDSVSNNTSGFPGVTWHKGDRKWSARISINGKRKNLGNFDTPEEASKVRETAYIKAFGEKSCAYKD